VGGVPPVVLKDDSHLECFSTMHKVVGKKRGIRKAADYNKKRKEEG